MNKVMLLLSLFILFSECTCISDPIQLFMFDKNQIVHLFHLDGTYVGVKPEGKATHCMFHLKHVLQILKKVVVFWLQKTKEKTHDNYSNEHHKSAVFLLFVQTCIKISKKSYLFLDLEVVSF